MSGRPRRKTGIAAGAADRDDRPLKRIEAAPRRRNDSESRRLTEEAPGPSQALRDALRRFSLCRGFVHQFALLARPAVAKPKRKIKGGGSRGARPPWLTIKAMKRKPGLAAAKAAQRARSAKGRPSLPPLGMNVEWPEAMKLELFLCCTSEQRRNWQSRWSEILSGQAALRGRTPARPAASRSACRRRRPAI